MLPVLQAELAEIVYMPWEQIFVHEVRKLEPTDFFSMIASMAEAQKTGATAGVAWIDGIAFASADFPETPEVVAEKLKGRLHKAIVWYTETSFQTEKKASVNGREVMVKLARADGNQDFVNLVEFLKTFKPATTPVKIQKAK
jgi:hypothetical protein